MAITYEETGAADILARQLTAYHALIRRERRVRYVGVAFVGVGFVWFALALLTYINVDVPGGLFIGLALTLLLSAGALLFETITQPSPAQIAQALDKRLDDRQRMVTAAELLSSSAHDGLMAQAQLSTSADMLSGMNPRTLYPARLPWPQLAISVGLLMAALGLFILKGANDDYALVAGKLPTSRDAASAVATSTAQSGLPASARPSETPQPQPSQFAQPQSGDQSSGQGNSTTRPLTQEEAVKQAQTSRDAQKSLQRLEKALDEQSATQGAADSLRRGNYSAASGQLTDLGKQNDQLSEDAKQGIASALDKAVQDSAGTPDLQKAEGEAAQALRSGDYNDTANALQALGKQLEQTSGAITPQQDLAKSFPDQPTPGSNAQQNGQQGQQGQQNQDNSQQGQQSQQGANAQNGQQGQQDQSSQQGQTGQNGQTSNTGQSGQGQRQSQPNRPNPNPQTGKGEPNSLPGEGSRVNGPPSARPDVGGNPFELQGSGNPNNLHPGQGNSPPSMALDGNGGGSSGPTAPGQGGPVTANGETNSPPVERWGVVQKYFSPDGP